MGWQPSEEDVANLAVCLFAGVNDISFAQAERTMEQMPHLTMCMRRSARVAFDHPAYLPSILAERAEWVRRIRYLEGENARLRAQIPGELPTAPAMPPGALAATYPPIGLRLPGD